MNRVRVRGYETGVYEEACCPKCGKCFYSGTKRVALEAGAEKYHVCDRLKCCVVFTAHALFDNIVALEARFITVKVSIEVKGSLDHLELSKMTPKHEAIYEECDPLHSIAC